MSTSRSSDFGRSLWFATEFRTKRVGVIANIKMVFLQAGLHQGYRGITRFLWLKDINGKVTDDKIQIYWLVFDIISSPFLLSTSVEHHLDETNTATTKKIKDDIYTDNVIKQWWRSFAVARRSQRNLSRCINESTWLDIQLKVF